LPQVKHAPDLPLEREITPLTTSNLRGPWFVAGIEFGGRTAFNRGNQEEARFLARITAKAVENLAQIG
jgi:hypothetical protein